MAKQITNPQRAIEQARKNIKVFEAAIDAEMASIREWRKMIEDIDRKAAERKAAKLVVEVIDDGNKNGPND